jgi:hypothetical protein
MSPTKKRQTMGKMTRERELRERRELKQEKKDAKKQAAADGIELPEDNAPREQSAVEEMMAAVKAERPTSGLG